MIASVACVSRWRMSVLMMLKIDLAFQVLSFSANLPHLALAFINQISGHEGAEVHQSKCYLQLSTCRLWLMLRAHLICKVLLSGEGM